MGGACTKSKAKQVKDTDATAKLETAKPKDLSADEKEKTLKEEMALKKKQEEEKKAEEARLAEEAKKKEAERKEEEEQQAEIKRQEEENRKKELARFAEMEAKLKEEELLRQKEEALRLEEAKKQQEEEQRLQRILDEKEAKRKAEEAERLRRKAVSEYPPPEICDPCTLDEEALIQLEGSPCSPRRSPLGSSVVEYAEKFGCDMGDMHDPRTCPICYLLDLSDTPLICS